MKFALNFERILIVEFDIHSETRVYNIKFQQKDARKRKAVTKPHLDIDQVSNP